MAKIEWILQQRPTAFYAAAGLDQGRASCLTELTQAVTPKLVRTNDRLLALEASPQAFWQHLLVLSATNDSTKQITKTVCHKTIGSRPELELTINEILGDISDMMDATLPFLEDCALLETRVGPINSQWLAYGNGLLAEIGRLTDPGLIVPQCRAIAVLPVFGGGGRPHLQQNSVHIEAVLTNNDPALPEVLRLTWAISQLNNDLPIYSETINRRRITTTSGLAMLPATLLAGQELGLTTFDRATIEQSIRGWQVSQGPPELLAEIVDDWWGIVQANSFNWGTALQALDRMTQGVEASS